MLALSTMIQQPSLQVPVQGTCQPLRSLTPLPSEHGDWSLTGDLEPCVFQNLRRCAQLLARMRTPRPMLISGRRTRGTSGTAASTAGSRSAAWARSSSRIPRPGRRSATTPGAGASTTRARGGPSTEIWQRHPVAAGARGRQVSLARWPQPTRPRRRAQAWWRPTPTSGGGRPWSRAGASPAARGGRARRARPARRPWTASSLWRTTPASAASRAASPSRRSTSS